MSAWINLHVNPLLLCSRFLDFSVFVCHSPASSSTTNRGMVRMYDQAYTKHPLCDNNKGFHVGDACVKELMPMSKNV